MDHTRRATTLVTLTALSLGVLGLVHEAHARPTCGRIEQTEAYKPQNLWPRAIQPDPRAELLVPVNVVRIYSDEHSADLMAPRAWITAQLELANRLYRFSDPDMASYGGSRLAPCVQFTLNRVYDVHEREVSETLGYAFDTELVYGAAPTGNGERKVGTRDLRTLKVTDGTQYLTVFCVWEMKNPLHEASGIGGEANIGFASRLPTGPRRVLTKVTAARARMGVVTTRRPAAGVTNRAPAFGR